MNVAYDVIVIGGGVVGLTAAIGLAKHTDLSIALVDSQSFSSKWQSHSYDRRVSAISLASQRIFSNLEVWKKIQSKRISPYTQMVVWDDQADIHFDAAHLHIPTLGYIVEDSAMRASLIEELNSLKVDLYPEGKLNFFQASEESIQLKTGCEKTLTAKLVIGADGAHSWLRTAAQISLDTRDYHHTAIVTHVKTSQSHQKTAWQRFLKTGPLAFLPLEDEYHSSIVWSTLPDEAQHLLQQDDETFKFLLEQTFQQKLSQILTVDTRYHFPLQMRHAKNYVLPRIALIGDAAHTLHPLAGQGVNLGLLDATCLIHVIKEALSKNRQFASLATLRKYERWRKGENLAMLKMVEWLKYLFMNEKRWAQSLRAFGLNFTDRVSFLKHFFVNHAIGNSIDLPELAQ